MSAPAPAADRVVEPADWPAVAGELAEQGHRWFDWLSLVDEGDGRLTVVLHVFDRTAARGCFLRTTLAPDALVLASVAAIWPGAGWHEREAAEMFGVVFDGHPDPRPLLLPDGFAGHPLRKDFPLATRATTDWPGAHEPTEHGPAARPPGRRRPAAPGVPDFGRGGSDG